MIENDADRLALLQTLGESVLIGSCAVYGVFDSEYLEDLDGPGYSSSAPVITCRTSDLSNVTIGTEVVHNSTTYTVREIEPDGTGMTMLRLRTYG